jgi:hypothetical protein
VSLTPCSRFASFVTYAGCKFAFKELFSIFPPHFPPPLKPPSKASPSPPLSSTTSPSPQHEKDHFILPCLPGSALPPSNPYSYLPLPPTASLARSTSLKKSPLSGTRMLSSRVSSLFTRSNPSWFTSPYHLLVRICCPTPASPILHRHIRSVRRHRLPPPPTPPPVYLCTAFSPSWARSQSTYLTTDLSMYLDLFKVRLLLS